MILNNNKKATYIMRDTVPTANFTFRKGQDNSNYANPKLTYAT